MASFRNDPIELDSFELIFVKKKSKTRSKKRLILSD